MRSNQNGAKSCSCCLLVDRCCLSCLRISVCTFEYLLLPLKWLLKYPLSCFERPYSFMMLCNFFLLVTPIMLKTLMIVHFIDVIKSNNILYQIFFISYPLLALNYYFTFQIYEKYGIHQLNKPKVQFTVKSYLSYLIKYLFYDHKIGLVASLYFIQLPLLIYLFYLGCSVQLLDGKYIEYTVVTDFMLFGLICNIVFLGLHLLLYFVLLFAILCKINNSGCCGVVANLFSNDKKELNSEIGGEIKYNTPAEKGVPHHAKVNSNAMLVGGDEERREPSTKITKETDNPSTKFGIEGIDQLLKFYEFIRIYEYEKELCRDDSILKGIE